MSKKSRRRNKKILAALALAGGAAMLGRGKGVAQGVSGADKAASCCLIARCNLCTNTNSSIIFSPSLRLYQNHV